MDIVNRIKALCQDSGITLAQLENEIGFSNGVISKWKKSSPKVSNLEKIALHFNVSIDYLVGRSNQKLIENTQEAAAQPAATPDEEQALTLYRQLDDGDRGEIRGTMRQMLKADKYGRVKTGVAI